jgi:cell division protease FtsH
MSDELGPMRLGQKHGEVFLGRDLSHTPDYSDVVAAKIDTEVRRMLDDAHHVARTIMVAHRTVLDTLADELMATETLEVAEVERVLGPVPKWRTDGGEARVAGRGQSAAAVADRPPVE